MGVAGPSHPMSSLAANDENGRGVKPPRRATDITGIVLDLDGTVCVGERMIDGASEAIERMRAMGHRLAFVSNSIDGRKLYAERLQREGVAVEAEDIFTATEALRHYLETSMPGATLFAIADPPLQEILSESFAFSDDPTRIEAVIAGPDRNLSSKKLNTAFQALRRGARFLATNTDPTCLTDQGEIPDAGAVIGALEGCSRRRVEQVVGKPSPFMVERALAHLECAAGEAMMVGDRLETDIVMGRQAGMATVLVLTGVSRAESLAMAPLQPDFVLQSICQLPGLLELLA